MEATTLEFTGERMVPGLAHEDTFWEHVSRYRFANRYTRGKDVLDIACGEGYGSVGLQRAGANSVVGVDVSAEAVEHARQKYKIDARIGSAEAIPLPNESVDVVVSFETIEHVASPERFLRECARVLRPGGRVVISTPNLQIYHQRLSDNPFHCSEMSLEQFGGLMSEHFNGLQWFGQNWARPWYLIERRTKRVRALLSGRDLTRSMDRQRGAAAVCAATPGFFERLLWRDTVRRLRQAALHQCMYLVVVATRQ